MKQSMAEFAQSKFRKQKKKRGFYTFIVHSLLLGGYMHTNLETKVTIINICVYYLNMFTIYSCMHHVELRKIGDIVILTRYINVIVFILWARVQFSTDCNVLPQLTPTATKLADNAKTQAEIPSIELAKDQPDRIFLQPTRDV